MSRVIRGNKPETMRNSRLQLEARQKLLVDVGLLAMLALFIGIITVAYISSERNFHWWIDWYARTLAVAITFRDSPAEAVQLVQHSLVSERNRLFMLPLIPFILVFGSSRLVYELGLALVYLLPFALTMGAIATQLIRRHSRTVFWATAFLTLLIPVTWIPTFMGIPDTGGAALVGLATFVYLQDVRLKHWWRIPLIGFLIGAAILLRRPFVYAGVAFFGALTLQALIVFFAELRKQPSEAASTKRARTLIALPLRRLFLRVRVTEPVAYGVGAVSPYLAQLAKRTRRVIVPRARLRKPTAPSTATQNAKVVGAGLATNSNSINQPITPQQNPPVQKSKSFISRLLSLFQMVDSFPRSSTSAGRQKFLTSFKEYSQKFSPSSPTPPLPPSPTPPLPTDELFPPSCTSLGNARANCDDTSAKQTQQRFAIASSTTQWAIAWQNLLGRGVRIALIGTATLTTLWIVAPQFTYTALTKDYRTLYTSWSLPFQDIFNLYTSFYGWGTWLMVVLGFSACILTRALPLAAVSFIGLSGILSLFIWLIVLRYGNVFYSLQVTPLVVIGLVALIWTAWIGLRGKVRMFVLGVVGCYLLANLIVGLTPIGTMSRVFHPLFALSMPPLVRTDYDEAVRLVNYLRQLTPRGEPIFVVGYQRLQLTSGMLRSAEYVLHPTEESFLNILAAPEVDSRDSYPLEKLLEAQYVVIPSKLPDYSSDPTQIPVVGEWLPNKEYDVVNVVFDAFTQNWEIARDFKRLPVQFNFENGVVVSIYQRTRPTSLATAVRTLQAMQQKIVERPGLQENWIILSQWVHNTRVEYSPNNTYEVVAFRRDRPWGEEERTYRIFESTLLAKELGLRLQSRHDSLSELVLQEPTVATLEESVSLPSALPKVSLVRMLRSQELEQQNSTAQLQSDRIPLALQGHLASSSTVLQEQEVATFGESWYQGRDSKSLLPEPSSDRTQQLGTSLLYLGPVADLAQVSGAITYIDRACVGSFLRVAMLDSQGQIVSSTESAYNHSPRKITKFELSVRGQNPAYLLFNILNYDRNDLVDSCTLRLNPLKVSNSK